MTDCTIQSVCNFLNCGNTAVISGNGNGAVGCQDATEVSQLCGVACCPVTDLVFTNQNEIDAFRQQYPNCFQPNISITIEESGTPTITNLDSLAHISSIGENLIIANNPNLSDISALQNLFILGYNRGALLRLENNPQITSLDILTHLSSFNLDLEIINMDGLTDLSGFANLPNLGRLQVEGCDQITSLNGLGQLQDIYKGLILHNNSELVDISNLAYTSNFQAITVTSNAKLSDCSIHSFCNFLNCGNTYMTLNNNLTGCNSTVEVQNNCAFSGCCPNSLFFGSQAAIDDFPNTYPNCSVIPADVVISGEDITDLSPLNSITTIGTLVIGNCSTLVDMSNWTGLTEIIGSFNINSNTTLSTIGLPNLVTVGGTAEISTNPAITNIVGLSQLETVQSLSITNNDLLETLSGLSSLTTFTSGINISQNNKLTDISGLANIVNFGNNGFSFSDNQQLSQCAITSVCTFLDNGRNINVYNNAPNCNSEAEIVNICDPCPTLVCKDNLSFNFDPDCSITLTASDLIDQVCDRENYHVQFFNLTGNTGTGSGAGVGGYFDITLYSEFLGDNTFEITDSQGGTCTGSFTLDGQSTEICDGLDNDCNGIVDDNLSETYMGDVTLTTQAEVDAWLICHTKIDGNLTIEGAGIQLLGALNQITEIMGNLTITNCPDLNYLYDFQKLRIIGGTLSITDNATLSDIYGLSTTVFNDLVITNNAQLTGCAAQSVCNFINCGNTATISGNGNGNPGCQDVAEVAQNCGGQGCCLTADLVLTTQQQVDDFPTTYPNCNSLLVNVTIEDDLSDPIQNLDGLSNISSIFGNLTIRNNPNLSSLQGLSSLFALNQGSLLLENNPTLTDLTGLDRLNSVHSITIKSMNGLSDLTGLTEVNGLFKLTINNCANLTALNGTNFLVGIYDHLILTNNPELTDISSLDLVGLQGLVTITDNAKLANCSIYCICNLINCSGANNVTVSNNAAGCNDITDIQNNCVTNSCCPSDLFFFSQADIDAYNLICPTIAGRVFITGDDVTDLSPLSTIETISGQLSINGCSMLTSLAGLDNLEEIGEVQILNNPLLTDLALPKLETVTGNFQLIQNQGIITLNGPSLLTSVGGLTIFENNSMTSIGSFPALTTINQQMAIQQNAVLEDISGLANVNAATMQSLFITYNPTLSTCAITSVCDFVENINGRQVEINNNTTDCQSLSEVQQVCNPCPALSCVDAPTFFFDAACSYVLTAENLLEDVCTGETYSVNITNTSTNATVSEMLPITINSDFFGNNTFDLTASYGTCAGTFIMDATLSFTAPADLCVDAGVQTGLGGGSPTGGVYSGTGVTDDGNGMTYSFDPAAAGTSTHTITYIKCNKHASDEIEIFDLPIVSFTAPADLCIDAGVKAGLGGGSPTGGIYSGTGVTDDGNGVTYSFDPAAAGLGTHTITYLVADANGCENSMDAMVQINQSPTISSTDQPKICYGESFDLSTVTVTDANNTNATLTYHSSSPATNANELTSVLVAPNDTTDYYILATNGDGCTDELAVTVNVVPEWDIQVSTQPSLPDTICLGETYDLFTLQFTGSTPVGGISYHSATPATSANELTSSVVAPTADSTFYIRLEDFEGCVLEVPFKITVEVCCAPDAGDIANNIPSPNDFTIERGNDLVINGTTVIFEVAYTANDETDPGNEYDYALLLLNRHNTIKQVSYQSSTDFGNFNFSNLAPGDYRIFGLSYKQDNPINSLADFLNNEVLGHGTFDDSTQIEALEQQGICLDLDGEPSTGLSNVVTITPASDDYYWVGGTGDWSDFATHWAKNSGGTDFHTSEPPSGSNVYFDENSGVVGGVNWDVTVDKSSVNIGSMNWSGVMNAPKLLGNADLNIHGSLTLDTDMDISQFKGNIHMRGATSSANPHSITSAGHQLQNLYLENLGGHWELADDLLVRRNIYLNQGSFYTRDKQITCNRFFSRTSDQRHLNLGNSLVKVNRLDFGGRGESFPNLNLDAGTSTFELYGYRPNFRGGGYSFYNAVTNAVGNDDCRFENVDFLADIKTNHYTVVIEGSAKSWEFMERGFFQNPLKGNGNSITFHKQGDIYIYRPNHTAFVFSNIHFLDEGFIYSEVYGNRTVE
ncbi:MAG: hypothetical protein AAGJ18_06175, partial [Bacteroidota bacterium]